MERFVPSTPEMVSDYLDSLRAEDRVDLDSQGAERKPVSVMVLPPMVTVVDIDAKRSTEMGRTLQQLLGLGRWKGKQVFPDCLMRTDGGMHLVYLAPGVEHPNQDPTYQRYMHERGRWYQSYLMKTDGSVRTMIGCSDNGIRFAQGWNKKVKEALDDVACREGVLKAFEATMLVKATAARKPDPPEQRHSMGCTSFDSSWSD